MYSERCEKSVCLETKKRCRLCVCSGVLDWLCFRAMAWHTGYA